MLCADELVGGGAVLVGFVVAVLLLQDGVNGAQGVGVRVAVRDVVVVGLVVGAVVPWAGLWAWWAQDMRPNMGAAASSAAARR